jgi:uncharacterized membrane protein
LIAAAGLLPWVALLAGPRALCLKPVFHPFCHQIPERTLSVGVPMLVCSRCAGLYLGMSLGALISSPNWSSRCWRILVLFSGTLMALDVLTQDLGYHPPLHSLRIITGLLVGWTASAFLFSTLKQESRG